ncbi:MAG TPA: PilZ domain-containing protein [Candidatus Sulfotelmatobacter sp.]
MHAASPSARRARTHHRQSLHTLTYVILDEANGGIIRNLNHEGIAIQAVAAVRLHQRLRVRFELRRPRIKVDTMGEVVWANVGGQCGIRFLDLSAETMGQINQWILGDLLDSVPSRTHSIFGAAPNVGTETSCDQAGSETDGLLLSPGARKVIQLPPLKWGAESVSAEPSPVSGETNQSHVSAGALLEQDWLSRPVSARQMAWTLNSLIVIAASLLFSLVFLAVTQDLPRWPLDLEAGFGAVLFVMVFYWFFFRALGGTSMGVRLARLAEGDGRSDQESRTSARFR